MFNFSFNLQRPQEIATNFEHPNLFANLPTIQEMFNSFDFPACDYPVVKHRKMDNSEPINIMDPDCFFRKEADLEEFDDFLPVYELDYERSSTYQNTEGSSFAMSPSRDFPLSIFSDIPTPESSPLDVERKLSDMIDVKDCQDEIMTSGQLYETIAKDLRSENMSLIKAIEQALQGKATGVQELNNLSCIEASIVDAILQKKDFNQKNKKQKGKKREEEKQKFFFKGVLKHTEAKFFGVEAVEKKKSKKKQVKRDSYYEYYWGEVAKEHNVDLSNFFHPNKKLASGKTIAQITSAHNPGLKSLNTTYIDLILTSDKFKVDTIDYLDNVFLKECQKARVKKIAKLMTKLNSLAKDACKKSCNLPISGQVEAVNSALRNYLVENPKSKLPWTDSELQEARDFAYGVILRQSAKSYKNSPRSC